jgi:transcriptional regulator with XRE-family HTH domain
MLMGRASRSTPMNLGQKLRQIREALELSQDGMLIHLGLPRDGKIERSSISAYELGRREPPLQILLQYARAANVYVDALIDDDVNLPEKLPCKVKSAGIPITRKS